MISSVCLCTHTCVLVSNRKTNKYTSHIKVWSIQSLTLHVPGLDSGPLAAPWPQEVFQSLIGDELGEVLMEMMRETSERQSDLLDLDSIQRENKTGPNVEPWGDDSEKQEEELMGLRMAGGGAYGPSM
ncbi:uncharacterized [Tachysurus ichikawai]